MKPSAWGLLLRSLRSFMPHDWCDLLEARCERWAGLDFTSPVALESLGLDPARSVKYSPSGNRYLRRVVNGLGIQPTDRLLDMGCGKGSAMRLFLEFPFAAVDGVEVTERLADIARRNFARLGVAAARCRIFTADAASFTALDEYSHIYFYHPFTGPVMRDVATNIRASLARRPRPLTIIYYNAVCVDELTAGDSFRIVATSFDRERNQILVLQSAGASP